MPARYELKQSARASMRGRKPSVYLVALVYIVITYVLSVLAERVVLPGLSISEIQYSLITGDYTIIERMPYYIRPSAFGEILSVAVTVMSAMIGIGFTFFCLRVSRDEEAGFGNLFDAFGMFFKFLWLQILMWIFTFLWSLLFIIPGIIASYRYSMAVYIMMDNPEYSALECINRSKELMRGRKGSLFVLDLSFIGWALLAAIPFVSVFVQPYMEVTRANFYNALIGFIPPRGDGTVIDVPYEDCGDEE